MKCYENVGINFLVELGAKLLICWFFITALSFEFKIVKVLMVCS